MIRALIVDDEPPARENLRLLLDAAEDVEVVAECGSGPWAVEAIEELDPDLVFLDVQMPSMDGFEVIEAVGPSRMPITVFVTAYDRYALRAFETRALDYLLKPFDDVRFAATLERARDRIRQRDESDVARRMLSLVEDRKAPMPGGRFLERLTVRKGDRVVVVKVADVDRFEAAGDWVRVWIGGTSHLVDDTMKALEAALDPDGFVRIHRSHIVNVDRIRELEPFFHGDWIVRLDDGTELRLARTRRDALERALGRSI